MPLDDMPRRHYAPRHYAPRNYAPVTLCPSDTMPRWTLCPGGQYGPVQKLVIHASMSLLIQNSMHSNYFKVI